MRKLCPLKSSCASRLPHRFFSWELKLGKPWKKDYKNRSKKVTEFIPDQVVIGQRKSLELAQLWAQKIPSTSVQQRLSPEQGHRLLLIPHESMCWIRWMLCCPYQKVTRHPCPRITDSSPLSDRLQDVPISFVFLKTRRRSWLDDLRTHSDIHNVKEDHPISLVWLIK